MSGVAPSATIGDRAATTALTLPYVFSPNPRTVPSLPATQYPCVGFGGGELGGTVVVVVDGGVVVVVVVVVVTVGTVVVVVVVLVVVVVVVGGTVVVVVVVVVGGTVVVVVVGGTVVVVGATVVVVGAHRRRRPTGRSSSSAATVVVVVGDRRGRRGHRRGRRGHRRGRRGHRRGRRRRGERGEVALVARAVRLARRPRVVGDQRDAAATAPQVPHPREVADAVRVGPVRVAVDVRRRAVGLADFTRDQRDVADRATATSSNSSCSCNS